MCKKNVVYVEQKKWGRSTHAPEGHVVRGETHAMEDICCDIAISILYKNTVRNIRVYPITYKYLINGGYKPMGYKVLR